MYTTYPQNNSYAPQYNGYHGYAPMQQQMQPMAVAAPAAQSSPANMGLMMIAGLAVVGAAAFGGVYLMNSSHDTQPAATAAAVPSTVVNLPSEINVPGLTTQNDPASPVIVNNPGPVRVFTPSAPRSVSAPAVAPDPAKTDPAKTDPAKTSDGTAELNKQLQDQLD
ncbi:MAG: hypothetical protein ACXVGO_12890 [Mycobacterium sp.]